MTRKIKHLFGCTKGLFIIAFAFLLFPFSRLLLSRKKIWIVSEFGYEARDNGYSFFKYMRKEHPEVNCYYAIDFNSPDYPKIKELGNAIKFGSFKHFAYWCAAKCILSSKTQGFCPNSYLTTLRNKMHLWGKYIFLQHGITQSNQDFLYKENAKIDLFICGALPEFKDILKNYGYSANEVAYTGFSRFDDYFNLSPSKQILVMPTWRRKIENNANFEQTDYYYKWSELLNSSVLNNLLIKNGLILYFYLHPQLKKYIWMFNTKCSNIKILPFENCDFQKIIRDSSMFITDFSSLAFDFGYMKRPVIYYQYDLNDYFLTHYKKGYFDHRSNGFGPVCMDFTELINAISHYADNNFTVEEKYLRNSKLFFNLYDNKNSERIFNVMNDRIVHKKYDN